MEYEDCGEEFFFLKFSINLNEIQIIINKIIRLYVCWHLICINRRRRCLMVRLILNVMKVCLVFSIRN